MLSVSGPLCCLILKGQKNATNNEQGRARRPFSDHNANSALDIQISPKLPNKTF